MDDILGRTAGALSYLIASILETRDLLKSVECMVKELEKRPDHEECCTLVKKAIEFAYSDLDEQEVI